MLIMKRNEPCDESFRARLLYEELDDRAGVKKVQDQ
jgi:hypothetical protein